MTSEFAYLGQRESNAPVARVKNSGDEEVANSENGCTCPEHGWSADCRFASHRWYAERHNEEDSCEQAPSTATRPQDSSATDEAVARCESGVGGERSRSGSVNGADEGREAPVADEPRPVTPRAGGSRPTYRERREARAEQRREWAGARQRDGNAARQRHHEIADRIPFGQPILVGHHSERGARADQRRMENLRGRAVENWNMASRHEHAADSIESQLRTSIYRDDADAVERLQAKVAKLEAQREHVKTENAAYRREHAAELRGMSAYERSQAVPFAPYVLTNLSATIRRTHERIVEAQQVRDGDRGFGRSMVSRYGGDCPDCGEAFDKGDPIVYYRRTREAVCAGCAA